MTAQVLIIGFAVFKIIFNAALDSLADKQRRLPLPEPVADIYDADKYAEYLAYVFDRRKAKTVYRIVDTVILAAVIFSGYFVAVDGIGDGNVYVVAVITFFLFWTVGTLEHTILSYHLTFVIDERYNLNKLDKRGFAKDTALNELPSLALTLALLLFVVFVGEGLPAWTDGFSVGVVPAAGICTAIAIAYGIFAVAATALSVFAMMKKYRFEPMPEGELRSDIEKLIEGSKKKIRQIFVYDESSKSTEKNAFLAKVPGYRFFGIADNFMNENSHRDLLAVISHEVGHLKHRRNAWNYGLYAIFCVLFVIAVVIIVHPEPVLFLVDWTQASFGIRTLNYVVILSVFGALIRPFAYVVRVYSNCKSRLEEYEADREAVRNGYGRELEATLKQAERDELMNVNPHPVIEFLEYDHPGLANRVIAMREASGTRADVGFA